VSSHNPALPQPNASPRQGLAESGSESILRNWVLLAAAFSGAAAALVLQDETGIWYRDGSGLTAEQLAALGPTITPGLVLESGVGVDEECRLQTIETLPLRDAYHRSIGTLCVLSPAPLMLSGTQREGLELLAAQVQTFLIADRQKVELRATPRAPSATSFVPGLVHELRNFVFGISANLDAFNARFADHEEACKYGATIRKSMDRLNAFLEELSEYGDPKGFSWSKREVEPLLREAIEHLRPRAAKDNIHLQLHLDGALPPIEMDEQSLRGAFIRILDLATQHAEANGQVVLHAATGMKEGRHVISGHLDAPGERLRDVDLARLFEPFYFRASGLGRLALPGARRIFESHGGRLSASPGPEGGLRINFQLPG